MTTARSYREEERKSNFGNCFRNGSRGKEREVRRKENKANIAQQKCLNQTKDEGRKKEKIEEKASLDNKLSRYVCKSQF